MVSGTSSLDSSKGMLAGSGTLDLVRSTFGPFLASTVGTGFQHVSVIWNEMVSILPWHCLPSQYSAKDDCGDTHACLERADKQYASLQG